MPRKNNRHGPRAMPLNKISERVGVPIKQVAVHLPEPDEPEPAQSNDIKTKRNPWGYDTNIGKLRASWDGRGRA